MIPVLLYFYYIHFRGYTEISFWHYYVKIYFGLGAQPMDWTGPSWPDMNFGHLWFLEHLLLYVSIYSIFRLLNKRPVIKKEEAGFPKPYTIILFVIVLSIITFIVRVWYPTDYWGGFLFIIQTEYAHVPQYIAMFILGIIAYRRNWLMNIPARTGIICLLIGISLSFYMYVGNISLLSGGGFNAGNLIFSIYESIVCTSLSIGLLYFFRKFMNHSSKFSQILSQSAYSVYIIHVPVVVALQYSLQSALLPAVVKFLITIIGGVLFSFLLSHLLIRKIPYLQRIL